MCKLIIHGDLHGCLNEFQNFRKKLHISSSDIEVCVGDLITKGPYSIETLHFIQDNQILAIRGNHEDKIIRFLKHQNPKKINPIILDNDEKVDNKCLFCKIFYDIHFLALGHL